MTQLQLDTEWRLERARLLKRLCGQLRHTSWQTQDEISATIHACIGRGMEVLTWLDGGPVAGDIF